MVLLELADECKQHIWEYLDVTALCRVACVARNVDQGVDLRPIWQRHARALVIKEQQVLRQETGLLGGKLQRGLGSRNLTSKNNQQVRAQSLQGNDDLQGQVAVDWRKWYRHTQTALVTFRSNKIAFSQAMNALQELKTERSQLKEAMQNVKALSQADKRSRRGQMNCVRWMNRTHRRHAATANSIQAHSAAMSKAEIVERLQSIETAIQAKGKELFGVRSRAMKSLHRADTQLASGAKLFQDLDTNTNSV